MAAVITACRDDLALATVDPLYVHLYKNAASFAFYGMGWKTLPFDVAHIVAFANQNRLHVAEDFGVHFTTVGRIVRQATTRGEAASERR